MFNSLDANRRLAIRTVAAQALVAALVALGLLWVGARESLAAALGGGAVALGSLVLAWRSMSGPVRPAGPALARMVSGLLLKWFVVVGVVYFAMAKLQLPPLPLIVGMIATMAASFVTLNSKA